MWQLYTNIEVANGTDADGELSNGEQMHGNAPGKTFPKPMDDSGLFFVPEEVKPIKVLSREVQCLASP